MSKSNSSQSPAGKIKVIVRCTDNEICTKTPKSLIKQLKIQDQPCFRDSNALTCRLVVSHANFFLLSRGCVYHHKFLKSDDLNVKCMQTVLLACNSMFVSCVQTHRQIGNKNNRKSMPSCHSNLYDVWKLIDLHFGVLPCNPRGFHAGGKQPSKYIFCFSQFKDTPIWQAKILLLVTYMWLCK